MGIRIRERDVFREYEENRRRDSQPSPSDAREYIEGLCGDGADAAVSTSDTGATLRSAPAELGIFKQRDTGKVGKAFTTIFGIAAALSFIAIFMSACFMQERLEREGIEWVMIFVFGCVFFFAGMAIASSGVIFGVPFALIGGVIAFLSITYGMDLLGLRAALMDWIVPLLGTGTFFVVGIGMLTVPHIISRKMGAVYTEPVPARVIRKTVSYSRDSDGHRHKSYRLTWEFGYNNKRRVYSSNRGRSPERRDVGHVGELYIRPGDPTEVWEKPDKFDKILTLVMGVVFAAMGGFAMCLVLFGDFIS